MRLLHRSDLEQLSKFDQCVYGAIAAAIAKSKCPTLDSDRSGFSLAPQDRACSRDNATLAVELAFTSVGFPGLRITTLEAPECGVAFWLVEQTYGRPVLVDWYDSSEWPSGEAPASDTDRTAEIASCAAAYVADWLTGGVELRIAFVGARPYSWTLLRRGYMRWHDQRFIISFWRSRRYEIKRCAD